MNALPYANRRAGGRALAQALRHLRGRAGLLVLALPRGGVPVAYEVAQDLDAPLDVLVVRKLGHPGQPEYAIGAIATGGVRIMNEEAVHGLQPHAIEQVAAAERIELERRERAYRGDIPPPALHDRVLVLVDDGLATGSTMRAAVRAVRQQQPSLVCVAVPVGAADSCASLEAEADEVVCPARPVPFQAVGRWYRDFPQTDDDEVRRLLLAAHAARAAG